MTLSHQQASLEKVTWSKVRKDVHKVNPELATIIDEINPGEELPFYRAKYPFGATILDKGQFSPPKIGNITSDEIQQDLCYTGGIPIGLVLKKSLELCIKQEELIMSWIFMTPGRIFGLWRGLELNQEASYHNTLWFMCAGMASGFILPHIGDKISYKKLVKMRGLKRNLPRNLQEHCEMMTQMSSHKDFPRAWESELLFFSSTFFNKLKNHYQLMIYLQNYVLEKSAFWRNKFLFDFIWDSFVKILYKENITVKPHIVDIVKHLITIALGELPAFIPAIDDEVGPITELQNDLLSIYGLKHFSSTIMIPSYFNMYDPKARPVYWSLQLPYYFESMPKPKNSGTLVETLVQIHQLINYFTIAVEQKKLPNIAGTPIEQCLQKVKFTCFHSDVDSEGQIQHIHKMPKEDPTLYSFPLPGHKTHQKGFSDTTPFARGCVRISLR